MGAPLCPLCKKSTKRGGAPIKDMARHIAICRNKQMGALPQCTPVQKAVQAALVQDNPRAGLFKPGEVGEACTFLMERLPERIEKEGPSMYKICVKWNLVLILCRQECFSATMVCFFDKTLEGFKEWRV